MVWRPSNMTPEESREWDKAWSQLSLKEQAECSAIFWEAERRNREINEEIARGARDGDLMVILFLQVVAIAALVMVALMALVWGLY